MKKNSIDFLRFYAENELNEIISEKPQSRLNVAVNEHTILMKTAQITKNDPIKNNEDENKFLSINDIILSAKKLAKSATNLAELKNAVEKFDLCSLKKMATNTVFSDGNPSSKIMVIGEAPGNQEDLSGIPFCGDSGKLLDEIFKSISLDRTKFYITNSIFWRPPGNRKPTDEEIAICKPFVERHIELVDPKIVILVGATAMGAVLGIKDPITSVRGKLLDSKEISCEAQKNIKYFVIFHPSYLLRQATKKKLVWLDMLELERFLQKQ
jgi:DNA polymerase